MIQPIHKEVKPDVLEYQQLNCFLVDPLDTHHIHQAEELEFSCHYQRGIEHKHLQFVLHFCLLCRTTGEDH